jgi:hypothetical protein
MSEPVLLTHNPQNFRLPAANSKRSGRRTMPLLHTPGLNNQQHMLFSGRTASNAESRRSLGRAIWRIKCVVAGYALGNRNTAFDWPFSPMETFL